MIRITGGRWRGRRLATRRGADTRPSADAYRETIMTILGPDLTGVEVLDVFAGTGAFSFECLSRGATRAVLVERSRAALTVIRSNLAELGAEAQIVPGDAYRLPPLPGPFDIVFVAPPYPHFQSDGQRIHALLSSLAVGDAPLLGEDGTVVVQAATGAFHGRGIAGLEPVRTKRFGRSEFVFLERPEEGSGDGSTND